MSTKKRGLFLTMEGADGAGKSTQMANVRAYFQQRQIDALFTREPGGTPIGEQIRAIILDRGNGDMTDLCEAMLYAASRAQHVEQVILPALEAGRVVVCDRYVDSSIAYQGYGRRLGDKVAAINQYATLGIMPDATLFLDLDPEEGKHRIDDDKNLTPDRLETEKAAFRKRVYRGYQKIMEEEGGRFLRIDGSGSPEQVRDLIYAQLDRLFQKE